MYKLSYMSELKNRILNGHVKKDSFYQQIVLIVSIRFCSSDSTIFRAFVKYFVCSGFQLSNQVAYSYLLFDISIVNSHAACAYECELLAVTWQYLPSVRLDNTGSVIRQACKHDSLIFTLFKLIATFVLATLTQ